MSRWNREPFLFFPGGDALSERYLETSALGYRYARRLRRRDPRGGATGSGIGAAGTGAGAVTYEGEKGHAELRTDAEAAPPCACPTCCCWRRAYKKKKRGGAHATPSVAAVHEEEPELVALSQPEPPKEPHAVRVLFFMNCSYLSPETPVSDPHYVGSLTFFGVHGGPSRPRTGDGDVAAQRYAATYRGDGSARHEPGEAPGHRHQGQWPAPDLGRRLGADHRQNRVNGAKRLEKSSIVSHLVW